MDTIRKILSAVRNRKSIWVFLVSLILFLALSQKGALEYQGVGGAFPSFDSERVYEHGWPIVFGERTITLASNHREPTYSTTATSTLHERLREWCESLVPFIGDASYSWSAWLMDVCVAVLISFLVAGLFHFWNSPDRYVMVSVRVIALLMVLVPILHFCVRLSESRADAIIRARLTTAGCRVSDDFYIGPLWWKRLTENRDPFRKRLTAARLVSIPNSMVAAKNPELVEAISSLRYLESVFLWDDTLIETKDDGDFRARLLEAIKTSLSDDETL
ncbi:MAG: hypothetical protein U0872_02390 [Planctomycetaceae bacterium]